MPIPPKYDYMAKSLYEFRIVPEKQKFFKKFFQSYGSSDHLINLKPKVAIPSSGPKIDSPSIDSSTEEVVKCGSIGLGSESLKMSEALKDYIARNTDRSPSIWF